MTHFRSIIFYYLFFISILFCKIKKINKSNHLKFIDRKNLKIISRKTQVFSAYSNSTMIVFNKSLSGKNIKTI